MTHAAHCICVTCSVLRDRVPRRSEPVYAHGQLGPTGRRGTSYRESKYAIDPDDLALAELHANAARTAFSEPGKPETISRDLFDECIDCLYEYDLGAELPEHWPFEVRRAITRARRRILSRQAKMRILR
jgi:hypothetical protein